MSDAKIIPKIIGEKIMDYYLGSEKHKSAIAAVGKALSSPIRIDILNLVKIKPMSLQEIAKILHLPLSSTSMHVQCLEEAHLVHTENQPGIRGSMRVCMCGFVSLHIEAYHTDMRSQAHTQLFDMPVGNYFQFQVHPACGLAGVEGVIDEYDNPQAFYSPERTKAQLLWFNHGFVEYRFSNKISSLLPLRELSFSLELCAEAPGYCEDWPSDITFSINGMELGTYTSPGDFGMRRGRLTPEKWPLGRTQYGLLVFVSLREDGCYINEKKVNSATTLSTVSLHAEDHIAFRIEVKSDAAHVGGLNIFGEQYGDYPQGIQMRLVY